MDSIHHFILHIVECGLRDICDNKSDDNDDDRNRNGQEDEYYDHDFARMSARIASTRNKTHRFDRINASNKFTIKIGSPETQNNTYNKGEAGETTYLDSVYINLEDNGIDEGIVQNLANYVAKEGFDTESMDWDLRIDGAGNIQSEIKNLKSIKIIEEMFQKTTSMFL